MRSWWALMRRPSDMGFIDTIPRWIFVIGFGSSVLFALIVFGTDMASLGMQIFLWAKTGVWSGWTWQPTTLADAFLFLGFDLSLIYEPRDWKGLASITAWFLEAPLALVAPVVGFIVFRTIGNYLQAEG